MQQASYCARVRMRSMYILLIPRFFEQRGIFRGRIESSTSRLFYTIDINPRNRCPAYRVCIRGVWIRIASTLCSLRDNGKLHAVRRSAKSIVHVRARSISRTRALECFYLTANLLTESANWGMQGASLDSRWSSAIGHVFFYDAISSWNALPDVHNCQEPHCSQSSAERHFLLIMHIALFGSNLELASHHCYCFDPCHYKNDRYP